MVTKAVEKELKLCVKLDFDAANMIRITDVTILILLIDKNYQLNSFLKAYAFSSKLLLLSKQEEGSVLSKRLLQHASIQYSLGNISDSRETCLQGYNLFACEEEKAKYENILRNICRREYEIHYPKDTLKQNLKIAPLNRDKELVFELGLIYYLKKRENRAMKLFKKILGKNIHKLLDFLGVFCYNLIKQNFLLQAAMTLRVYRSKLDIKSRNGYSNYLLKRGIIMQRIGRYDLALADFLKLQEQYSDSISPDHLRPLIKECKISEFSSNLAKCHTLHDKLYDLLFVEPLVN
jgi:tetratricopeptide (TPR) repeat protein